jgi:hypothetical protein
LFPVPEQTAEKADNSIIERDSDNPLIQIVSRRPGGSDRGIDCHGDVGGIRLARVALLQTAVGAGDRAGTRAPAARSWHRSDRHSTIYGRGFGADAPLRPQRSSEVRLAASPWPHLRRRRQRSSPDAIDRAHQRPGRKVCALFDESARGRRARPGAWTDRVPRSTPLRCARRRRRPASPPGHPRNR